MYNYLMDEMILIDKPSDMTSFGVVARVRRVLSERLSTETGEKRRVKVGHAGTLDPFATGLLVLLAGKGTKKAQELLKLDKEYIATLKLGYTSTTGDPEGTITNCNTDEKNLDEVERVFERFVGEVKQRPPIYSAIKIDGKRAYKLAREGKKVEMPERTVRIDEIEVLEYEYPKLVIRVKCGSGTYIRTLAEDIGGTLGTGAYLTGLRRTQVGEWRVEDAVELSSWMNKA